MDGFGVNEGIIVIAATNRVDILDPAILRPGRFDRKVYVNRPDVKGREEILGVHAKNKPLADDVDLKRVAQTTAGFTGADRRMQKKGVFNGATVYDDYAHHPSELRNLVASVKLRGYKRILLAFQPHTYTRTHALFADFVEELKRVDVCCVAEIYAAREKNESGISSRDLCKEIPGAVYCETLPQVTERLREIVQPGDIVLTVGAGDIYKAGEMLVC